MCGEVRFRSFLLRCFTNWLANENKKAHRVKRGGAVAALPIDEMDSRVEDPALIEGKSPDWAYVPIRQKVRQAVKRSAAGS